MAEKTPMRLDLLEILGAAVGGSLAYLLMTHLPAITSVVMAAVIIAFLSIASARQTRPILWWAGVGAIAGSLVGAGIMLEHSSAREDIAHRTTLRYMVIAILAVGGLASGILYGHTSQHPKIPTPAEFLKRASGLTVVLFALIVTARYPVHGIDAVRTLSSRLSTMTTIIATSLAVPGWVGYLVGKRLGAFMRASQSPRAGGGTPT